jgi:hypothetical protein
VSASSRGPPKACTLHGHVAPVAQRTNQFGDMDPGAAVDGRWVFLAQNVDAHMET